MKGYKMNEKRYYHFHLDIVYKRFTIVDYQTIAKAHSFREAWRLAKSSLPFDLYYNGFLKSKKYKPIFAFCDVYSLHHEYLCTLKSIK